MTKNNVSSFFLSYHDKIFSNEGSHRLIELIRDKEKVILDVGCGAGGNAKLLKELGKSVYGITLSQAEAKVAAQHLHDVIIGDIETMQLDFSEGFFDAILLSHVLEHLIDPWSTVTRLKKYLRPGGRVYVCVPNIMFWRERLNLCLGNFQYAAAGIIDRLHLRFFTYKTTQELVREGGYRVVIAKALGSVPMWPLRRLFKGRRTWIDEIACKIFPNLFGYHLIVVGENI